MDLVIVVFYLPVKGVVVKVFIAKVVILPNVINKDEVLIVSDDGNFKKLVKHFENYRKIIVIFEKVVEPLIEKDELYKKTSSRVRTKYIKRRSKFVTS